MLPPVRAALNSNIDYQAVTQATPARAPSSQSYGAAQADGADTAPVSASRLDALSLSAQLKLAQSFSVFAETIGKVLQMPRGENEALADYAARISEAVQALKPSERTAIERLLNEIVKGVSLRLLTEILKNPAGPDAARLAAYIEIASAAERDLAAKAVVSSYRQNASADPAFGTQAPRPGAAAPVPTPAVPQAPATAGSTAPAGPSSMPQAGAAVPSNAAAPLPAGEDGEADPLRTNIRPASEGQTGASGRPGAQASTPMPVAAEMKPSTTPSLLKPPAANGPEGARSPEAETGARAQQPAGTSGAANPAGSSENRSSGPSVRFYDGPALARRSHDAQRQDNLSGGRETRSAGTGRAMADAAALLAALAAEPELPQQAHLATKPLPLPGGTAALPAPTEQAADGKPVAPPASQQASSPAEDAAALHRAPDAARAGGASPQAGGSLEQQFAALAAAGMPVIPREGVALPYVAYPPAEEEPPREDRKTRALSAIGDEEDDGQPQQHGFHDDQHQGSGEDEGEEPDGRDGAPRPDGEDEGRPNDLYWRMAGWN